MDNLNRLESESELQYIWRICSAKDSGVLEYTWEEVADLLNKNLRDEDEYWTSSAYRKKFQQAKAFHEEVFSKMNTESDDLDEKLANIRKERMKLQTLNLERTRIERNEARHELYYEYIANAIESLPVQDFKPFGSYEGSMEYLLCLADLHYGATFESANNKYSPEICKQRMEYLSSRVIDFITEKGITHINILSLGDDLQGLLRVNDLKINDSSVVKATVEVSRLIANFVNAISVYADVDLFMVPTANHTQTRNLGTKASELADEDLEYIIGNYVKDILRANEHVEVHLTEGSQYIDFNINGYDIIAGHGHTIKGTKNSLRNLNTLYGKNYQYAIFGHFHGGNMFTSHEGESNDCEVIIASSFIGSDPYSDSLMAGSKGASTILGFDEQNGHTETYKIILN